MRPEDAYYAPTGFFGSFCNTISSCLSLLCCCWLFRNCLGRQREPATPLMAPPQGPMDDRFEQLTGPHSPFGGPRPPGPAGPIHDRRGPRGRLPGLHSPFGASHRPGHNPYGVSNPPGPPGPVDHQLGHLEGPHSPFGLSDARGPPGPDHQLGHLGGPHSPSGLSDAPGPPSQHGPAIQHGGMLHPGPPQSHGLPGLPGPPPGVPGIQPGLL